MHNALSEASEFRWHGGLLVPVPKGFDLSQYTRTRWEPQRPLGVLSSMEHRLLRVTKAEL